MATLIAVNVGLPQDVAWKGRTTRTGIWKRPVEGPRMVRRLNIDGDGQGDLGGHGGPFRAVLVYQLDSYRYWQDHLGRDDFVHGQFGENFTVDGLPDDEVCIGDRYRIGDALFEVTQPRVTCYRVGLRMNEPRMPALLVAHGRPGFYLKVLAEGLVQAGDDIIKIADGPGGMTVADIDALLYKADHPQAHLERALRITALSPGWRASMQLLLDEAHGTGASTGNAGLTGAGAVPPPAWQGFRPLTVTAIVPESSDVFSLLLGAPDGDPLPAALPGQFVTVRMQPDPQGPSLIRSYSLSGQPGDPSYRISIKQEPHGVGSAYLRRHAAVHDTLDVAAPRGAFVLGETSAPVVLISAGVGVTPVLAMLHSLAAMKHPHQVWWIHGARDGVEHPFAREVGALLSGLPAGHRYIAYSRPRDDDRLGEDYDGVGRLSGAVLTGLDLPPEARAYVCGPTAFMDDMTAALVGCRLEPSRIHTEIFGSVSAITPGVLPADARAPHAPASPPGPGTGPSVSFARSSLTVPWDSGYGTLLDLAEACDVPVRWSCRSGVCHTCETALVSGRVDYSPDPIDAPADGNVLICCSRPHQDVIIDL